MNDELISPIDGVIAGKLSKMDESELPQAFQGQVALLKEAFCRLERAEAQEKAARERVAAALAEADKLVLASKSVGGKVPKERKFLWIEWVSNKDEIAALKDNLQELIAHNENSAVAQKHLAEVQAALLDSQASLLLLQKVQMEYQRQVAAATRFVLGLGAYNLATSHSVLLNLRSILSGESLEPLGELAEQQLGMALEQIRNQENLILRIQETNEHIQDLSLQIEEKDREIAALDAEQNRRIAENELALAEHEEILQAQQQRDEEFARMFAEQDLEDAAQDRKISENKNALHALSEKDSELTATIRALQDELEAQKTALAEAEQKISALETALDRKLWKIALSAVAGAALLLSLLQLAGIL